MKAENVRSALTAKASDHDASSLAWFFKTGLGQYGEGDVFIGVRMPAIRVICASFASLALAEVSKLLESPIHEERMAGLIIVANRAKKACGEELRTYFAWYLDQLHRGRINNWDLVDVTCAHVVGRYLLNNDRTVLYKLIKSASLWERRVALVSTFAFIRRGESDDAFAIAELVLDDTHDFIHKAAGWVLREVGKQCGEELLTNWLDMHTTKMPRTMLRYAIERLPEPIRQHYLHLK